MGAKYLHANYIDDCDKKNINYSDDLFFFMTSGFESIYVQINQVFENDAFKTGSKSRMNFFCKSL